MRLEFDSVAHGDDVYARGHPAQLLPGVVSPLAWSTVGQAFETANRFLFGDMYRLVSEAQGPQSWVVGGFGGRLFMNVSSFRTIAQRTFGSDVAAVDAEMGVVDDPGVPRVDASAADVRLRWRSTPRVAATAASANRRVRWLQRQVARERAAVEVLLADNSE